MFHSTGLATAQHSLKVAITCSAQYLSFGFMLYQLRVETRGMLTPKSWGFLHHADRLPRLRSHLEPVSPRSPWLMMPMAGWSYWQCPTLTAKQSASRVPGLAVYVCICWGVGVTQVNWLSFSKDLCVCVCEDGVILTPKAPLPWMWALVKGWSAWAEGLLGLSLWKPIMIGQGKRQAIQVPTDLFFFCWYWATSSAKYIQWVKMILFSFHAVAWHNPSLSNFISWV